MYKIKFSLISLGLMALAVQVLCQESSSLTEIGEINDVPASDAINAETQSVQEPSATEDKKLSKRSYGLGLWGWPEYGYGWPWPAWGGWSHGSHGVYAGHGGWYGGHGWPWWYSSHDSGWHGKW